MDAENTLIKLVKQSPRDFEPWKTLPEFFDFIPGVFMYQQAAREIADAEGWSDAKLQALLDEMIASINDSSLHTYCRQTGMTISLAASDLWLVTVAGVNQWLEARGAAYRWTNAAPSQPKPGAVSAPAVGVAQPGITKSQVLIAFDALVTTTNLSKAMADGVGWVVRARISKGSPGRGRHVSMWNPLLMSVELCEKKFTTKQAINRAFFTHQFLAPWREQWDEHSQSF